MQTQDRILLLLTGLLAAYQLVIGIDHLSIFPIAAFTVGFGALLIAVLLLIILGYEALDSAYVVVFSTIIPLSLSLGLVWQHFERYQNAYAVFACLGFLTVIATRCFPAGEILPTIVISLVHAVAGMIIFLLPILLAWMGLMRPAYAFVGIGGALIGIGGLLFSFQKLGKPILERHEILKFLPGLLLLTTICFVLGFR